MFDFIVWGVTVVLAYRLGTHNHIHKQLWIDSARRKGFESGFKTGKAVGFTEGQESINYVEYREGKKAFEDGYFAAVKACKGLVVNVEEALDWMSKEDRD